MGVPNHILIQDLRNSLSVYTIMMLYRAVLLVALAGWVARAQDEPETVPELKVEKYLGRWYQTYASPIVYGTFEEDGVCVTATYGVFNASTLTVYNHMRILIPNGPVNDINGFAYTTDEPGKLEVDLFGGSLLRAPYWIVQLGPESFGEEGLYDYAIVTDPFRLFLFVLARDVQGFETNYEAQVLEWLENNGFDSILNYPIKTYHDESCLYPEDA